MSDADIELPGGKRGKLVDPGTNGNSCGFRALGFFLIGSYGYTSLLRACAGEFGVHYLPKRLAEAKVSIQRPGDAEDLTFEDDVLFADTYLVSLVEDCVTPGRMIEQPALQAFCDAMGWCFYLRVDDGPTGYRRISPDFDGSQKNVGTAGTGRTLRQS